MGAASSHIIPFEEAERRCTAEEWQRINEGWDLLSRPPPAKPAGSLINGNSKEGSRGNTSVTQPFKEIFVQTKAIPSKMHDAFAASHAAKMIPTVSSKPKGVISKSIFCREVLFVIPSHLAHDIYAVFDPENKDFLSFKQFVIALALFWHGSKEERAEFASMVFDTQRTGIIAKGDIQKVLTNDSVFPTEAGKNAEQLITKCFEEKAKTSPNTITKEEFAQWAIENQNATAMLSWIFHESKLGRSEEDAVTKAAKKTEKAIKNKETNQYDVQKLEKETLFNKREIAELQTTFRGLCPRTSGNHMNVAVLGSLFTPPLPAWMQTALFRHFDSEGIGSVDFVHFVKGLSSLLRGDRSVRSKIWNDIFKKNDRNSYSKAEIKRMLQYIELNQCTQIRISSHESSNKESNESISDDNVDDIINKLWEKYKPIDDESLSTEQFNEWFWNNATCVNFVDHFEMICCTALWLKPRDKKDEAKMIKYLLDRDGKLVEGATFFVISSKWFSSWKSAVHFNEPEESSKSSSGKRAKLKPIDNSPVIYRKDNTRYDFRTNMVEKKDFELIPDTVWKLLFKWYGGGPSLSREVVQVGSGDSALLYIELYPLYLKISIRSPSSPLTTVKSFVQIGVKTSTVSDFTNAIAKREGFPPDSIRLWNYSNESNPVLLDNLSETLEEAKIQDGTKVVVERRAEDTSWPLTELTASGHHGTISRAGQCGLKNLGNTCFLNAAVQCLSHCDPLTMYFLDDRYKSDINKDNPLGMQGEMAKAYGELVRLLWKVDENPNAETSLSPIQLKKTIGKFSSDFDDGHQHDAQELLAFVIDGLHEDLNLIKKKPFIESKDDDERSDEALAEEAWKAHLMRNKSIIVDLFQGQLRSVMRCNTCKHCSKKFDPFTFLSISLPEETMRIILIDFLPKDGMKPVIRYSVRVPINSLIVTIKSEIFKVCGIKPNCLLLCEIQNHYLARIFTEFVKVQSIAASDIIVAYEVDPLSRRVESKRIEQELIERPSGTAEQQSKRSRSRSSKSKSSSATKPNSSDSSMIENDHTNADSDHAAEKQAMVLKMEEEDGDTEKRKVVEKEKQEKEATADDTSYFTAEPGDSSDAKSQLQTETAASEATSAKLSPANSSCSENVSEKRKRKHSHKKSGDTESDPSESKETFHVGAIIRYLQLRLVYFVQRFKPVLIGRPLMLSLTVNLDLLAVYEMVRVGLGARLKELVPNEAGLAAYPFSLKIVNKTGIRCGICTWNQCCTGCELTKETYSRAIKEGNTIAIEFKADQVKLYFDEALEGQVIEHESIAKDQILQDQPVDLDKCFEYFTNEEIVRDGWYCSSCKEFRSATKKMDIWKLPPILLLHFKRFHYNGRYFTKINRMINFPIHDLEVTKYTAHASTDTPKYTLTCCLNHMGGLGRGHYTSYCYHGAEKKWYSFDDSRCSEIGEDEVTTASAYVLVYMREDVDHNHTGNDADREEEEEEEISESASTSKQSKNLKKKMLNCTLM